MEGAVQVEVRKGKNESSAALIRRFSRRAQGAGVVRGLRNRRYFLRTKSKNVERRRALVGIARKEKYVELVKLGKIDPTARKTRGKGGRR
ncbi:MAG: hypothetical protein KGI41_03415 [Patescibacteria group bacterium]|nr:hypothetical protein [Patescibacteria group bacterium]MDE1966259.1 hypothetical protein [Patescibacteria group bacterium]